MPGLVMEALNLDTVKDSTRNGEYSPYKEGLSHQRSARSNMSPRSLCSDSIDLEIDGVINTSIDQLYQNVCEMESSDVSPSRASYLSYGQESRIDSELRHLVGDIGEMEITKEVVAEVKEKGNVGGFSAKKGIDSIDQNLETKEKKQSSNLLKKQLFRLQADLDASSKLKGRSVKKANVGLKKQSFGSFAAKTRNGPENTVEAGLDNPDLGPFLLTQTRHMIQTGDNPQKVLDFALRASKAFEVCANDKTNLEHVMSLHVLASVYCSLAKFSEAIPVLEHSIEIPKLEDGQNHALAKFAGCMQLGDTYAMLGQLENSILCYTAGLEIQRQALGEMDPRVGETCRYVAEAHVQAFQFDEAEKLCHMALEIHREKGGPASLEEAADRRLLGLICDAKRDYEGALEHYVLASMAMTANGLELDAASIDCSIGDAYLSLSRYDEAVFSYQKGLTFFKSSKGENHPAVASVYVRLADLYFKIGKFRDSKSYCENALRIYEKPKVSIPEEEIASGLIDISAIYQSMDELDQALKLLKKALKIYRNTPGQQSMVAGIEAQIGVTYYMMGNYAESYNIFKSSILKFRASGEKKSVLFGIALNQMGLACVQRYAINEAADLFEEARSILEKEYGPYHPETLGVCSNLAGTYDAMGRLDDAIDILDYVVDMREEKLGTAHPDVDDEKKRLAELLKEAGRVRCRKSRALLTLLDTDMNITSDAAIEVS